MSRKISFPKKLRSVSEEIDHKERKGHKKYSFVSSLPARAMRLFQR
jgi:hypothetical protein